MQHVRPLVWPVRTIISKRMAQNLGNYPWNWHLRKNSGLDLKSTYWLMEVRTIYPKLEFLLIQDEFSTQSYVQSSTWLTVMGCCPWWQTNKSFYSNTFFIFILQGFTSFTSWPVVLWRWLNVTSNNFVMPNA